MAGAIVEMVIEEIVEESAENAVENVVEEAVENAVEDAVEGNVKEAVENVAQNEVQTEIQEQVEQEVEQAADNKVENAVVEGGEGFWRNLMIHKVLPAVIAGLISGSVIEAVKRAIDASNDSSGGGSPSEDTEKGQAAASKVLEVVDGVTKRWQTKLEEYQSSDTDLGIFTYEGADKSAAKTIGVLVTNMKTELEATKDIAIKSTADKTWDEHIEQFKWRVANACEDLLAVYKVKKMAAKLQQLDFPPDLDKVALNTVLDKQMPNYKAIIKEEVKKHLQAAVSDLATKDAAKAVKALIREPLTNEIKAGFDAQVRPDVIVEAKKAARAEANVVMNSKMAAIYRHAAIPIYGISTLKSWMGHNVQPIAIRESTKKAIVAANAVLQLPTTQIKIIKISKTASEEMMKKYQTQIKEVAKNAAEEVIKQALKSGKNSNERATQRT